MDERFRASERARGWMVVVMEEGGGKERSRAMSKSPHTKHDACNQPVTLAYDVVRAWRARLGDSSARKPTETRMEMNPAGGSR